MKKSNFILKKITVNKLSVQKLSLKKFSLKIIQKITIASLLFLIIDALIIYHPVSKKSLPQIGETLNYDLIARTTIRYIDKDATQRNIELLKITLSPAYILRTSDSKNNIKHLSYLFNNIVLSENYEVFNAKYSDLVYSIGNQEFNLLKQILENNNLSEKIIDEYSGYLEKGLIEISESKIEILEASGVFIRKTENNTIKDEVLSLYNLNIKHQVLDELYNKIVSDLNGMKSNEKHVLKNTLKELLKPNLHYDKELSDQLLREAINNAEPIYKTIKKGDPVLKKGELITIDNESKVKAVMSVAGGHFNVKKALSLTLFTLAIMIFSYFYIIHFDPAFFSRVRNTAFISILLVVYVFFMSLPAYLGFDKSGAYYGLYLPISAFTFTLAFLFSKSLSSYFSIILAMMFFVISDYNEYGFIFIFASGVSSVFTISSVKGRADLLLAGLKLSIINILITLFIFLNSNFPLIDIFTLLVFASFNGLFSSLLAIGIIALGELLLNSPTIFRLQELSDMSSPLMQTLFTGAIGTYHHSIVVGNLAEAAAREIGANAVLARVGGYYHDIGKVDNPDYFIENQSDHNKHDLVKPSISVSIIKGHLKAGTEKALNNKLPKEVIDIISQHHGNTIIKYFYDMAIKNNEPEKEDISSEFFRYNGKNPQFPESAIVFLADQVEATCRSLKSFSAVKIEKLLDRIFDEKFLEGHLDESGLTLKDLTKIKKVFLRVLIGMYHSRIEYPEQTQNKNREENETNIQKN